MAITTKMRLLRAVVGVLNGAAITAVFAALLCFVYLYTRSEPNYYGSRLGWALVGTVCGGALGYVEGLVLGLFLGLMQRGRIFGTITGAIFGVAIYAVSIVLGSAPNWSTRDSLFCAAFITLTMLSGFLISLLLSAIPSFTKLTNRDQGLLSLEQVLLSLEQTGMNDRRL